MAFLSFSFSHFSRLKDIAIGDKISWPLEVKARPVLGVVLEADRELALIELVYFL